MPRRESSARVLRRVSEYMQALLRASFPGTEASGAIEAVATEFCADLFRRFPAIERCHLVVERLHEQQLMCNHYVVAIDVAPPSAEGGSAREPLCEDLRHSLGSAFAAAGFQLEDDATCLQTDVRSHAHEPLGRISRLFPDRGFGFIATDDDDGQEVYFHESSVANQAFPRLTRGSHVRFTYSPAGDDTGPRADSVFLLPW